MENVVKKGKANLIFNIIFWVLLAIVALYTILVLTSSQDQNQTTFFGVQGLTVQSNSMSPTFDEGDMIFIRTNFEIADLQVDDVITYLMIVNTTDGPVTVYNSHRIVEITVIDGAYWFTTKGDNNASNDASPVFQTDIVGIWNGSVWTNVGPSIDGIVSFVKSPTGFLLFLVVPCLAFLIYEIVKFAGVVSDYKVQKTLGDRVKIQEEAVAIAKAQLEAEMKAKAEQQK